METTTAEAPQNPIKTTMKLDLSASEESNKISPMDTTTTPTTSTPSNSTTPTPTKSSLLFATPPKPNLLNISFGSAAPIIAGGVTPIKTPTNNTITIVPLPTTPSSLDSLRATLTSSSSTSSSTSTVSCSHQGKLRISPELTFDFTAEDLEDLGEIGRGAYGTVNKMLHTKSATPVAVKRIRCTVDEREQKKLAMDLEPERIDPSSARGYDIRSDVWSLGITLYEISTGTFPYPKWNSIFEQLCQVVQGDPPRLLREMAFVNKSYENRAETVLKFSPEFVGFVNTCLIKDELQRPKYSRLLQHPFLQRTMKEDNVNVKEYFARVFDAMGPTLLHQRLEDLTLVGDED